MVWLYGKAPYKIVLVHGGPGAIGSLKGFAQELNERSQIGVLEAIQSKYSTAELIEELYNQIRNHCNGKVSLAGHSWGAWLVALFAEKYPELVRHIILTGSGPLEDKYVSEISTCRQPMPSGKLLTSFQNIKCKIYLIQGEFDPHPVKGVTIPLQENNVPCETFILEKCGHSPFMEKYAKDEFYKILIQIIT